MEETPFIRPRLYGDPDKWQTFINMVRDIGIDTAYKLLFEGSGTITFDSKDNSLTSAKGTRIKSLEDLLTHASVDLDEWEVRDHVINTWEQHSVEKGIVTLFQVKAWLRRKGLAKPDKSFTEKWLAELTSNKHVSYNYVTPKKDKPIVLVLADLHIGAIMENSRLIPDYNVEILSDILTKIAADINSYERPVHLMVVGDVIESFTGKNKADTWKQIELHGSKVALTAFDVLYGFFTQINHLKKVYMVGGNHDRITDSKNDDPSGQVVELLYGMFKRMSSIEIDFDPLILTPAIDNIQYIVTHGDHLIKKKNAAELVIDYGNKNLFNLLLSAHRHSRIIRADKRKFRDLTIPSILSGSAFEERNNWNSLSGYVVIENNGNNLPRIVDNSI